MPDANKNRENWAVWVGSLLALVAVLCNVVFFVNLPGLWAIAWLSMLLSVVALIFLGLGLKHAFGRPVVYRRKILSSCPRFGLAAAGGRGDLCILQRAGHANVCGCAADRTEGA